MPLRFCPDRSGPFADAGCFRPQIGIADHFFDVAEPVRPLAEALAGERTGLLCLVVLVRAGEGTALIVVLAAALVALTRLLTFARLLARTLTGLLTAFAGLLTLARLLAGHWWFTVHRLLAIALTFALSRLLALTRLFSSAGLLTLTHPLALLARLLPHGLALLALTRLLPLLPWLLPLLRLFTWSLTWSLFAFARLLAVRWLLSLLIAVASLLVSLAFLPFFSFAPRVALHFAIEFASQLLQFGTSPTERFRLVTQHSFGRSFDTFTQLLEAFCRGSFLPLGVLIQPLADGALGLFKGLVDLLIPEIASRFVKPLGQNRLGRFRPFDRIPHPLLQIAKPFALVGEFLRERLAIRLLFLQRRLHGLGRLGLELLGNSLFLFFEFAGCLSEILNFLGKAVRGPSAKLLAEVVELLLGSGASSGCLADFFFLQGFRRPADLVAGLVELPLLLGHPLLVLRLIEPRLQLVGILQHLPFFFLQPLKLLLQLFLLLRRVGRFEGRLQFLEPLVQVMLPLSEFAKPVEDLAVLAFLG